MIPPTPCDHQLVQSDCEDAGKSRAAFVAGEEWAEVQERLHGLAGAYTPDSDD
jgi:hypothetical protein